MRIYHITVLFILMFSKASSQQWEMNEMGNAFDGFGKMCAVEALESTPKGLLLGVINDIGDVILDQGFGENGFINNLHIRLLVDESYFDRSEKVTKILMSFDREKEVYQIGRLYQSYITDPISIEYAFLGDNYGKCFNKVDICNLFKIKGQVNFRLYTESGYHDVSFPLSGSKSAIEKTFKINGYIRKGDWTDFSIEYLFFAGILSRANDGEADLSFASPNCGTFLKENYGEYYFILVQNVKVLNRNEVPLICFYDVNGFEIASIGFDVALRNEFFASGNRKQYKDSKVQRDVDTIELYYTELCEIGFLDSTKISIDEFINSSDSDLKEVYSRLKAAPKILEIFLEIPKCYIHYSNQDYTFEVFKEPWGQ